MKKIFLLLFYFLYLSVSLNAYFIKENKIDTLVNKYPWLNKEINDIIIFESNKNEIDPKLVYAIIKYESALYCNNNLKKMLSVRSYAGAIGLMQIIPKYHTNGNAVILKDPRVNIKKGISFFKELLLLSEKRKYKNILAEALRMYNQGPYGNRFKYKNWNKYVFAILKDYNNTENLICLK